MEKSDTLPATISSALLLLRIASAMAFLYHGSAILFRSFGGPGPQQFAASHHWPVVMGYLIGLAQFAGCAEWRSVSTRSGLYCRCDAWSYLSGAPSQWVRYRQRRRGICAHTVVTGSSVPLSRAGLVLAGVLASGIAAEILNPHAMAQSANS